MRWVLLVAWPIGSYLWMPEKLSKRVSPTNFSRRQRVSGRVPSYPRSSSTRASPGVSTLAFPPNQTSHRFARTLAMERICALLVDGMVPFDEPLSERAIADSIAIGRMPVREALRDLAREGIVSVE